MSKRDEHTFVFADLSGFTALTEAHGDEQAADLVAAFCDSVRELLSEHGGEEVKVIGDAMMLRCPDAGEGIRLATRVVSRLGERHGFPSVRVGMHTGTAVERDGDWYGATVNVAARVAAVDPAHGAGTLIHDRTEYHFCSLRCASAFAAHPERYAVR